VRRDAIAVPGTPQRENGVAGTRTGYFRISTAAILIAASVTLMTPAPVQAQNLFDLLLGALRGAAPRAYNREMPRLLEGFPGQDEDYQEDVAGGPGGPYVAYCVRMCDGRYFPLPRNAGAPSMTPAKVCSAMCPSAQTKVFSGTQIDRAVAPDGKNYSSIPNAFVYRDRLVSDCSCNGRDPAGIAAMDVEDDPSLRAGDIVVTAEGPKVFKGGRNAPHKTSDFVPAEDYRGLPKSVRQQISEMRIAPERLSATVKSGASAAAGGPGKPKLSLAPKAGEAMLDAPYP
jgi:hypothetical protein